MKYLILSLIGTAAALKKCSESQRAKGCPDGLQWEEEACACFSMMQCMMMCPPGQQLSPLLACKCIDQCEYDELFTDERLCQTGTGDSDKA